MPTILATASVYLNAAYVYAASSFAAVSLAVDLPLVVLAAMSFVTGGFLLYFLKSVYAKEQKVELAKTGLGKDGATPVPSDSLKGANPLGKANPDAPKQKAALASAEKLAVLKEERDVLMAASKVDVESLAEKIKAFVAEEGQDALIERLQAMVQGQKAELSDDVKNLVEKMKESVRLGQETPNKNIDLSGVSQDGLAALTEIIGGDAADKAKKEGAPLNSAVV